MNITRQTHLFIQRRQRTRIVILLRPTLTRVWVHVRDFVIRPIAWEVFIRDGLDFGTVPIPLNLLRGPNLTCLAVAKTDKKGGRETGNDEREHLAREMVDNECDVE